MTNPKLHPVHCGGLKKKSLPLAWLLACPALCLLLIAGSLPAFAQNFEWANGIGGSAADQGLSTAVDAAGNVYITGSFSGTADFDPGPGTTNLTSVGGTDLFIAKYTAVGAYLWAMRMGSAGEESCRKITLDAAGNIYVTGTFNNTVDFDPGPGTANLTATGTSIFVAKYNSGGNYVWAIGTTGGSFDPNIIANGIALDAAGNICITGNIGGAAIDFDPGPGTANLLSAGNSDAFLAKYDVAGNYLWAIRTGATGQDGSQALALDAAGNVYIGGPFTGTVDFDPGPGTANLTSVGGLDAFVAKYDAAGNYVWAIAIGGLSVQNCSGLAVDAAGNIVVTGTSLGTGTVDFDPGPGTANLTGAGSNDFFVAKYDAGGNYIWAISIGSTSNQVSRALALDAAGNVYVTGFFASGVTVDFDPGPGVANLTPFDTDIFVAKYDAGGNYVWAANMGSASFEEGTDVAVDAVGNVHVTGRFNSTADFDPGPGVANLTSAGGDDAFLLKLSQSISSPVTWYLDADNDGWYVSTQVSAASPGAGWTDILPAGGLGDCDDSNPLVHAEFPFYVDNDGDGFGTGTSVLVCAVDANTPPSGYSLNNTDCDDNNALIHAEFPFYTDNDGDGFGVGSSSMQCAVDANTPPTGFSTNDTDCDDNNALIHAEFAFYIDNDGDGFGVGSSSMQCAVDANTPPTGFSTNDTDCDDNNNLIHAEFAFYIDNDGDGFGVGSSSMQCAVDANTPPPGGYSLNNTDCDDNNDNIHPGATEICGNSIDDNCNGQVDEGCVVCPPCTKAPKKPAITISGISLSSTQNNKFCPGDTITVSVNVPDANACTYNWTAPAGGNILGGQGTASVTIELSSGFTANSTVSVYAENPCGQTVPASKPVNKGSNTYKPGAITQSGDAKVCPGETRIFSVPVHPAVSSYSWTTPAGANILNGQGTENIEVAFTAGFTASGYVEVVSGNACGASAITKKNAVYGTKPPVPSAITGANIGVCSAANLPYSTAGGGTGYTYNWFFDTPEGSVSSGQGTASITASFTTAFTTGALNVTAANGCGVSNPKKLNNIKAIPAAPTVPSGPASVCSTQMNVAYSIPAVQGATTYTWTGPNASILSDGVTTSSNNMLTTASNSILVNFNNKKGNVKVVANNACGSSGAKSLAVVLTVPCGGVIRMGETEESITLFPNPVRDVLRVMFTGRAGKYMLRVYDALGKEVWQQNGAAHEGMNQAELNVSGWATGVYQLFIAGEGLQHKARFIVE